MKSNRRVDPEMHNEIKSNRRVDPELNRKKSNRIAELIADFYPSNAVAADESFQLLGRADLHKLR